MTGVPTDPLLRKSICHQRGLITPSRQLPGQSFGSKARVEPPCADPGEIVPRGPNHTYPIPVLPQIPGEIRGPLKTSERPQLNGEIPFDAHSGIVGHRDFGLGWPLDDGEGGNGSFVLAEPVSGVRDPGAGRVVT
jgi:hypothetical protein